MTVNNYLEQKLDEYIESQNENIQDKIVDNIEDIKYEIKYEYYLIKKILDYYNNDLENRSSGFKFLSKSSIDINADSNNFFSYKNKPFFYINKSEFDITNYFHENFIDILEDLLLALKDNLDSLDDNLIWFFISESDICENKIIPLFKFILLSHGESFHNQINSSQNTFLENNIRDLLINNKPFAQYREISYILSEYLNTSDILFKYLLLYHVFENFMYRKPIADLVSNEFTIREFKLLYKKVSNDEEPTLKIFLKDIKEYQLPNTKTIEEHFNLKINDFRTTDIHPANNSPLIDILDKMTLPHINGISYSNASKLIYYFRNAIIHNKETEYHITHTKLNECPHLVLFFNKFLLPYLENIIYYLIFKDDSLVDYADSNISLYSIT